MNASIESRPFDVVTVEEVAGTTDRYKGVLRNGEDQYVGYCNTANKPTVGEALKIFYQERELDFAFQGLSSVTKL